MNWQPIRFDAPQSGGDFLGGDVLSLHGLDAYELGQTARYIPTPGQILTRNPKPGTFYRSRKGVYPWNVAKVAYAVNGMPV